MIRLLCIGEAMIALRLAADGSPSLHYEVAGDTYNTAVYAKRILGADAEVCFLSAVGADALSDVMLAELSTNGVSPSLVARNPDRSPGLYFTTLDQTGERSFSYWRSESAARTLLAGYDQNALERLFSGFDAIHFSGITLAILTPEDRHTLIAALGAARSSGSTRVSFDPNYRPRLWASVEDARDAVERGTGASTLVLPGRDDEIALFGRKDVEETIRAAERADADEVVVKNGVDGIVVVDFTSATPKVRTIARVAANAVVDTTAAGDSFAAGYLTQRLIGRSPADAAHYAATLAAQVIAHQGAIISRSSWPAVQSQLDLATEHTL